MIPRHCMKYPIPQYHFTQWFWHPLRILAYINCYMVGCRIVISVCKFWEMWDEWEAKVQRIKLGPKTWVSWFNAQIPFPFSAAASLLLKPFTHEWRGMAGTSQVQMPRTPGSSTSSLSGTGMWRYDSQRLSCLQRDMRVGGEMTGADSCRSDVHDSLVLLAMDPTVWRAIGHVNLHLGWWVRTPCHGQYLWCLLASLLPPVPTQVFFHPKRFVSDLIVLKEVSFNNTLASTCVMLLVDCNYTQWLTFANDSL